jgi:hypothetical protein
MVCLYILGITVVLGMLLKIRKKHDPDEPSPQLQKGIAEVQQCLLVKKASDYKIQDKARETVPRSLP